MTGEAMLILGLVSGLLAMALVLSGDWFSAIDLPGRRLAVALGDVEGHGTESAVTASALKQSVEASLLAGRPAAEVVDLDGHRMHYVSAGHPPALLWQPGAAVPDTLAGTGPVLCELTADASWEEGVAPFPGGATMAVFSDGLTEASPRGCRRGFGQDRLVGSLSLHLQAQVETRWPRPRVPCDPVVGQVFDDVVRHAGRLTDDSTLALVRNGAA